MILAHAVILLMGWAWLAISIGPGPAWVNGVAPFVLGALGKSGLAGFLAWLLSRRASPAG